jgi:hypothetical protein
MSENGFLDTLLEQSEQVRRSNAQQAQIEERADRDLDALVKQTTAKIMGIIANAETQPRSTWHRHPFSPGGLTPQSCLVCGYKTDAPHHHGATPARARDRLKPRSAR